MKFQQSKEGDNSLIKLVGAVDQNADYSGIQVNGFKTLKFDFDGVALINSAGIQKWINFLKTVPDPTFVYFERAPVKIVHQLNLFPGFTAGKKVHFMNFYAPYYCEHEDKSYDILTQVKDAFQPPDEPHAPHVLCPSCKGPLEFDAIEKKYFLFLKRAAGQAA